MGKLMLECVIILFLPIDIAYILVEMMKPDLFLKKSLEDFSLNTFRSFSQNVITNRNIACNRFSHAKIANDVSDDAVGYSNMNLQHLQLCNAFRLH